MRASLVAFIAVSLSAVALGLAAAASQSSQKKAAPLIVGVVGDWMEYPSKRKIGFLSTLSGENSCVFGNSGSLTVQFDDKWASFPCNKADQQDAECSKLAAGYACARLIKAPDEPSLGGFFASLIAAVTPLISRDAERYVTPVSRGLDPELTDAVVSLRGNSVDFAPAFADLQDGSYTLRLEPLQTGLRTAETTVNWKEGGGAVVTIPGLAPGLYRVARLVKGASTGQDAWVAVSSADLFEKRSESYRRAVEATRQWPSNVDVRAPRAVLRAYLQALTSSAR